MLFSNPRGGEEFCPRQHPELSTQFFLIGREDQIDNQRAKVALTNDCTYIQILPVLLLG